MEGNTGVCVPQHGWLTMMDRICRDMLKEIGGSYIA